MNMIRKIKALYFGIEVELICQLDLCSLVRFQERSLIVDTSDLVLDRNFQETTKMAKRSRAA